MQQIFHDPALEATFQEKGYVKVKLLDKGAVNALRKLYHDHLQSGMQGFHTTLLHDSPKSRRKISDSIIALAQQELQRFLKDYEALVGNFVVKEPGENSILPVHQDWTVVPEPQNTALNVWCALQDIEINNGAIRMYPGSHKLERYPRSPSIPNPYQSAFAEIDDELVTETVKTGEALIFEGSLIHASFPNLSEDRRLATALIMIPEGEQACHYYYNPDDNKIEKYSIDRDFFDTFHIAQRPEGYPLEGSMAWDTPTWDREALRQQLAPPSPKGFLQRVAAFFRSRNR